MDDRRSGHATLAQARQGNAALRSPASADAPEHSVLDVRSQPDSHRRRRTERRISRDARNQRFSRRATDIAERERPDRRLGAAENGVCLMVSSAQIISSERC
jgi:hypothetical protein